MSDGERRRRKRGEEIEEIWKGSVERAVKEKEGYGSNGKRERCWGTRREREKKAEEGKFEVTGKGSAERTVREKEGKWKE